MTDNNSRGKVQLGTIFLVLFMVLILSQLVPAQGLAFSNQRRMQVESAQPVETLKAGCCQINQELKSDVRVYRDGLDIVLRLRPISFTRKEDNRPDIGLSTEEVARVVPELVSTNGEGEAETVRYERINLLLINAVKEHQAQIKSLRDINATLNSRLRVVEKTLRRRTSARAVLPRTEGDIP